MHPLRYPWHLVKRFFGAIGSRSLSPEEQDRVAGVLTAAEAALFWRQQSIDQRHAWQVASLVEESLGDNNDAIAAALLHDVGKTHSSLGPMTRSLATVFDHLRLPMPERWRLYRRHEVVGAVDLLAAGARPLAVAFAAGEPMGDPAVWEALVAADDGQTWQRETSSKIADSVGSRNSMPPR